MTKTYQIHARCVRSFTAWIETEAETADEALTKARLEHADMVAAAWDCEERPWDDFTVYGDDGAELLHLLEGEARIREAAPELLAALKACELQLREYVRWHHANAGGCSVEIEGAWERACEAIAKAKGGAA
jgi:hypothetical protein